MTKLKTLKDTECILLSPQMYIAAIDKEAVKTISAAELRNIAREWLDNIESDEKFSMKYNTHFTVEEYSKTIRSIKVFIKHFFNIERT